MTNFFLPLLPALTAATELVTVAAELLLLCLGLSAAARGIDFLHTLIRSLIHIAELLSLLLCLLLSATGDLLPHLGRHAGAAAGRMVRWGRAARRWWGTSPLISLLDFRIRSFIAAQCGDGLPALKAAVTPCQVLGLITIPAEPEHPVKPAAAALEQLTIRELKRLASRTGIVGYGHLTKAGLVAALSAV